MEEAGHEFSDAALRVAADAARVSASVQREQNDRKRPREKALKHGRRGGAKQALKSWRQTFSFGKAGDAGRRLEDALEVSTARPICDGGLAHYFISEAHRRSRLPSRPGPCADDFIAALPASCRKEGPDGQAAVGECAVCMDSISGMNTTLLCGHAFHKKCIVSWLRVSSSCPCCRTPMPPRAPYRYPARTKLHNAWLRARTERRLDMGEVALLTWHLPGISDMSRLVYVGSRCTELWPLDSVAHGPAATAASSIRDPALLPSGASGRQEAPGQPVLLPNKPDRKRDRGWAWTA